MPFAWCLLAHHVVVILGRRVECKSANSHLQLQEVGLGLHSSVRIGDWMWVCSYAEWKSLALSCHLSLWRCCTCFTIWQMEGVISSYFLQFLHLRGCYCLRCLTSAGSCLSACPHHILGIVFFYRMQMYIYVLFKYVLFSLLLLPKCCGTDLISLFLIRILEHKL